MATLGEAAGGTSKKEGDTRLQEWGQAGEGVMYIYACVSARI
jgi:hypothetical protein